MKLDTKPMGGVWRIGAVVCDLLTWSITDPPEISNKINELENEGKLYKLDYELVDGLIVAQIEWLEDGPQFFARPLGKQVIRARAIKNEMYMVDIFVDKEGAPQYAGLRIHSPTNQRAIPDVMRGYYAYQSISERWTNDIPRGK